MLNKFSLETLNNLITAMQTLDDVVSLQNKNLIVGTIFVHSVQIQTEQNEPVCFVDPIFDMKEDNTPVIKNGIPQMTVRARVYADDGEKCEYFTVLQVIDATKRD